MGKFWQGRGHGYATHLETTAAGQGGDRLDRRRVCDLGPGLQRALGQAHSALARPRALRARVGWVAEGRDNSPTHATSSPSSCATSASLPRRTCPDFSLACASRRPVPGASSDPAFAGRTGPGTPSQARRTCGRPAECNSATRQITNLRFERPPLSPASDATLRLHTARHAASLHSTQQPYDSQANARRCFCACALPAPVHVRGVFQLIRRVVRLTSR